MAGSRRTFLRASIAAGVAACVPELFAKQVPARTAPGAAAQGAAQGGQTAGAGSRANGSSDRINHVGEFLEELRMSRTYTLECARAMPEERYPYTPAQGVRTYGQQMIHLGDALRGMFELYLEERRTPSVPFTEAGSEPPRPKDAVMDGISAAYDYVEAGIAKFRNSELRKRVKTSDGRELTKHRALRMILDHATHHRSQCVVYLRMNGVRPPEYRA